ncbi:hypothetical protein [Brachybacterium hainanense]|uniref:Uncharacterized protein n=1 Tax=Brachybacterium hainanense TaxID=1541174 RepID=A0ABV6RAC6_9MICO
MNLRSLNLQYAALKRIEAVVKEGMAWVKERHLEALLADTEQSGGRQWAVDVEGEKVATLSLSGGKSKPVIVSESELIAWALEHRPDMVETAPRLTEQAKRSTLPALVADYIDGTPVTEDGEVIPGVEEGHGSVYQSLRWTATKSLDGKGVMDAFITELGVAGLIEDITKEAA